MSTREKNDGVRMEKCPAHDDRNPSLAVSGDGRSVCMAGCTPQAVEAARAGTN
jgi:DNA primase